MHQDIEPEPVELEPDAPDCPRCFRATQRVQLGAVTWHHCPVCRLYWLGPRAARRATAEQERQAVALLRGAEYVPRPTSEGY